MVAKRKSGEGLSPSQVGYRYRKYFEEVAAMCETARTTQNQNKWRPSDKIELFEKLVEMFEEKTQALKTELAKAEKTED